MLLVFGILTLPLVNFFYYTSVKFNISHLVYVKKSQELQLQIIHTGIDRNSMIMSGWNWTDLQLPKWEIVCSKLLSLFRSHEDFASA